MSLIREVNTFAEAWRAGLKKQKEIMDSIKPDDERIAERRLELMMQGWTQMDAEALAREEFVMDQMKGTLGIMGKMIAAQTRQEEQKEVTVQVPEHRYGHNHPDPGCHVNGCAPCSVRKARGVHNDHIKAGTPRGVGCSICIESEGNVTENDYAELERLEVKRAGGKTLSKKELRLLEKLGKKYDEHLKTFVPVENKDDDKTPTDALMRGVPVKPYVPPMTVYYPYELERFKADLDVIAAVNDLAFIAPAINEVRKFIDTRMGDLFEQVGLDRTGKAKTPEDPECPNGAKCSLPFHHKPPCKLNSARPQPAATTTTERQTWCTIHDHCDKKQHDCRLTYKDGSAVRMIGPYAVGMCNNDKCVKHRDHALHGTPCYEGDTASKVVTGRNLIVVPNQPKKENPTVLKRTEAGKTTHYDLTDFEIDDDRIYLFKCLKSPDGVDTSKEDHMWYAKVNAKAHCPRCGGRPSHLRGKPLTAEQEAAYKQGKEKGNAPSA